MHTKGRAKRLEVNVELKDQHKGEEQNTSPRTLDILRFMQSIKRATKRRA